jgi:8-amino-7-oxononanoate synthase
MSSDVALLSALRARLDALSQQHLIRQRRTVESACGPQLTVSGHTVSAFCSNDYLGLAGDARIAEALAEGASRYGAGSGASHLISGHSKAHAALEEMLAHIMSPHLVP